MKKYSKRRIEMGEEAWAQYQIERLKTKAKAQANKRKVTRYRRIMKQKMVEYKGSKCSQCDYNKPFLSVYHFHHIDPSQKKFSLSSKGCSRGWSKIIDELDKCILLCANCHSELHEKEFTESRQNDFIDYQKILDKRQYNKVKQKTTKRVSKKPNREILVDLIWKHPTTHIANQYGVSDKAVEKWCKSYSISKPPRGYWQKYRNSGQLSGE